MKHFKAVPHESRFTLFAIAVAVFCLVLQGCSSKEVNYTPPVGSTVTAITHFSFSKMVVDGKEYTDTDVAIGPDGKARAWHVGHSVDVAGVEGLLGGDPHTMIIGIGVSSQASPTPGLLKTLRDKGIDVHILDTPGAVTLFNRLPKQDLVAVFHTGC